MKQTNYNYKQSETSFIAGRILSNYKRDKPYFEQYSTKFNYEFLAAFEEKVNALINLTDSQKFNDTIKQAQEKIETLLQNFNPLLDILQSYLRRNFPLTGLSVADLKLWEIREVVNKMCVWEIQRNCLKLINRLEANLEEFIDKGFIIILISDFRFLIKKLTNIEDELAEMTHQQGVLSDEFRYVDNQVTDLLNTIIESTPAVFGEDDRIRRDDYAIEKLMFQSHYKRSEIQ